jgi:hypothetical protein
MMSLNVGEPHDNKNKRNLTLTRGYLHLPFFIIVIRHKRPLVEEEILIFPFLVGHVCSTIACSSSSFVLTLFHSLFPMPLGVFSFTISSW